MKSSSRISDEGGNEGPLAAHRWKLRLPSGGIENVDQSSPLYRGLSGREALATNRSNLTKYEQVEIVHYDTVYYVGKYSSKQQNLHQNSMTSNGIKACFTDCSGGYCTSTGDHICYRYEIVKQIGSGSFGTVYKCKDHRLQKFVAIKVCFNQQKMTNHARHESSVLAHIQQDNSRKAFGIAKMLDHFRFRGHMCLVFELLGANLYDHIKANRFQPCRLYFIKCVALQMLDTLQYLGTRKVIHCDIKPENILLVRMGSCAVKLIDFGSSCFVSKPMYTYVQSRYYRSPEVLLGLNYGPEIDIWSLACVLVELATSRPLFAGENEGQQLAAISSLLGDPPAEMIEQSPKRDVFFQPGTSQYRENFLKFRKGYFLYPQGTQLRDILGFTGQPSFVDFLTRCLRWNPADRITPLEAVSHPWLNKFKFQFDTTSMGLISYSIGDI
jgi:dual specificity tyrosine-phosphorylation-regulated kinase 2/3/4